MMIIRSFDEAETEAVVELWNECGLTRPWNDPRRDIQRKLTVQPELFLVGVEPQLVRVEPALLRVDPDRVPAGPRARIGGPDLGATPSTHTPTPAATPSTHRTIVATAMVGFDGHRGWVNYLAVAPAWQRRGYARQLMTEAEALLTARGCPKLNLQVRSGNSAAVEFYRSLGYIDDNTVSFGKRLIPDD